MTKISISVVVMGIWIILSAQEGFAERLEMPIGRVFVPSQGYDDHDNIQVVLDGILPNGCYTVSDYPVTVDPVQKEIRPRLFAIHRTDGPCTDETHLSNFLRPPVPYTLEVPLGSFMMGEYKVLYPRPGLPDGKRLFSVQKAKASGVDNNPYASVSSVWIPDSVRGDLPIEIELIGSLVSTCDSLVPEVNVKLEGDVFIVLPKLTVFPDPLCAFVMRPFKKTLTLGASGEGRFMIQVRSMNGHAVNRAFSAVVPDPE